MQPSFSLKWLFVGTAFVAAIVTAVWNANLYWEAAIFFPTYVLLVYSVLEWAIRRRPWSVGFAAGGWSYAVMQYHFRLPTTRASQYVLKLLGRDYHFYDDTFDLEYYRGAHGIVECSWTLVFAVLGMLAGLYLHRLRDERPAT